MIELPDRRVRLEALRISKDFRKTDALMPPYPGAVVPKVHSDLEEARNNARYVWRLYGNVSRFSDGTWPVFYTAKLYTTACSEVGYHMQEVYLKKGELPEKIATDHILYHVEIKGKRRGLSFETTYFPVLCGSADRALKECRMIARNARAEGVDYLKSPSARSIGKRCYPVFSQNAVSAPKRARGIMLEMDNDISRIFARNGRRRISISISREY